MADLIPDLRGVVGADGALDDCVAGLPDQLLRGSAPRSSLSVRESLMVRTAQPRACGAVARCSSGTELKGEHPLASDSVERDVWKSTWPVLVPRCELIEQFNQFGRSLVDDLAIVEQLSPAADRSSSLGIAFACIGAI